MLRHYIGRSKISIPFYYEEPTEERYKQINCILKQDSFRENVYKVFSFQIIQYYYQNNDQHTKQIIESYNSFCNDLKDLNFIYCFDKQICVIRLAKGVKASTNRYLQIAINYAGIEKLLDDNLTQQVKNKKEPVCSEEDKAILNITKQYVRRYNDTKEKQFLQTLKAMLLVTIINELNHYVRRVACIGEDEGGKEMFKAIFGIEDFIIWNYHQALDIYHSDNRQKNNYCITLYKEESTPCILRCMTIKEKEGSCVERYK